MPSVYLSPSAQEGNFYVTGQSEEQVMNALADRIEPYLDAADIDFERNSPSMGVNQIIRDSNSERHDLHVALHSNAAPEGEYGTKRGIIAYYYPGSAEGKRAAEILAGRLGRIYPEPSLVRAEPIRRLGELRYTDAPSVFLEVGFHDNADDANWNLQNLDPIARTIVEGLAEYFGTELSDNDDDDWRTAVVVTSTTGLNLRAQPAKQARVLTSIPNGTRLSVRPAGYGWYETTYRGNRGYIAGNYLRFV